MGSDGFACLKLLDKLLHRASRRVPFLEMIKLTKEHGKNTINLGLGVNQGIRRFKEKWGGTPYLNYEFCECYYGYTRTVSLIKSLEGKL